MTLATTNPSLVAGAIVPHAPLLLPEVGEGVADAEVLAVRQAAARLDFEPLDLIVVLSPHGPRAGVYECSSGDLSGFGIEGASIKYERDAEASRRLAAAWDVPEIEEPVDHGVLVPLQLLGMQEAPVVAACLAESEGAPASTIGGFAASLAQLDRRVLFVASVNTSAGLSPRAPLTRLPGAPEIEAKLGPALERDPGAIDGLATELEAAGGSCSRGPLSAFGLLFAGRPARVLAHVWPFGVGYMVAAVGDRTTS